MPRGKAHSTELRATAIAAVAAGESERAVARRLGINHSSVHRWVQDLVPANPDRHLDADRSPARLAELIYDTVISTLESIRARATATGRPEWIAAQSAEGLAALDAAQWDRVSRVLASFRPVDDGGGAAGAIAADAALRDHRNGAVGPTR